MMENESKYKIKKHKSLFEKYPVIAIFGGIAIFGLTFSIWFQSCQVGKNAKDYNTICVEGHEYYHINSFGKMGFGIKLDNNGKPIKCEPE